MGITIPTKARFMNHKEYEVVTSDGRHASLPNQNHRHQRRGRGRATVYHPDRFSGYAFKNGGGSFSGSGDCRQRLSVEFYERRIFDERRLGISRYVHGRYEYARSRNDARLAGQKQHFRAQLCFQFLLKSMSFGQRGV